MEATGIPCIDLKARFGRQYRVTFEESYHAERPDFRAREAVWLRQIPCRYGSVFPFGGSRLAASVDGFPKVAGRLRRLGCVEVVQDGDFGELTVSFDVADFPKVARIMRPRRRRQVSPAERERLRRMGFQKAAESRPDVQHAARTGVSRGRVDGTPSTDRGRHSTPERHTNEKGADGP